MKRIYTLSIFFSIILFLGCSKDILKSYDNRIIGTWRITNINRFGLGGNAGTLTFKDGTFTFNKNGTLTYVDAANANYQGTWEIIKKTTTNEETVRGLQLTAIDFTSQQVLAEYYDDMNFRGTNHFSANVNSGLHTYITHFRR